MKKALKTIGKLLLAMGLAVGAAAVGLLLNLSITEYRPENVETAEGWQGESVAPGESLTLLAWNTGYAALDAKNDFFMDGGRRVLARSEQAVAENLQGMLAEMQEAEVDIYLLQEVDMASKRSFYTVQDAYYKEGLAMEGAVALNYKCEYVPYPFPTLGPVESGLLTLTNLKATENSRISLPVPFSWPLRLCNLKRCLLETRMPIEGSDKELVIVNLHLEAYDDGEGKKAQTEQLMALLHEEYEKGNYVVAGGDFNQTFPGADAYPVLDAEFWQPGLLETQALPQGFSYCFDQDVPSCRLLNQPYAGNEDSSQFYVIDGFIVSDNIVVEKVETKELGFANSDHQPVLLQVRLAEGE